MARVKIRRRREGPYGGCRQLAAASVGAMPGTSPHQRRSKRDARLEGGSQTPTVEVPVRTRCGECGGGSLCPHDELENTGTVAAIPGAQTAGRPVVRWCDAGPTAVVARAIHVGWIQGVGRRALRRASREEEIRPTTITTSRIAATMIIRRPTYRGQRVIAGLSRRGTQRGRTAAEGRPSRGDKRVGPRAAPAYSVPPLVVK